MLHCLRLSTITAFLLVPALLCQGQVTSAPLASDVTELDPKCPEGTYSGFGVNTWEFDIPAAKFVEKMGSFFGGEWYSGPIHATEGADNTVGSKRSGKFCGVIFNERLAAYSQSPSDSDLSLVFVLDNGPIVFPSVNMTFASYVDDLSIKSICSGRATYISFTIVLCADKPASAYDFFDKARKASVGAVADGLGAKLFAGSCKD
ncbi:hypothetical protein H0H81_000060 [Sphagnurus paluster]|uniref:Uncharacterized protein n=1 Tax=Sphagnurus paluster TaxID=117069 RepID=A0A9P7K8B4_9AGAR|nr:hypothetical protein H0H81_000060 [Sphagnurus paluster]